MLYIINRRPQMIVAPELIKHNKSLNQIGEKYAPPS